MGNYDDNTAWPYNEQQMRLAITEMWTSQQRVVADWLKLIGGHKIIVSDMIDEWHEHLGVFTKLNHLSPAGLREDPQWVEIMTKHWNQRMNNLGIGNVWPWGNLGQIQRSQHIRATRDCVLWLLDYLQGTATINAPTEINDMSYNMRRARMVVGG